jgi:uncharacterized protein (DUF58 family)
MLSPFTRIRRRLSNIWRGPTFGVSVSLGGLTFIIGTLIIGMAAIDADANLLLMVFGLCFGAILMSLCTGWWGLRGLHVERMAPELVVQGQPFEIRYTISNPRLWGIARSIHLIDIAARSGLGAPSVDLVPSEAFFKTIRPGQTLSISVPTVARKRGRLCLSGIRLKTRFPFAIFQKSVHLPLSAETIVLPRLGRMVQPIRSVRTGMRSSDWAGGSSAGPRIRGDEEYYGIREYRHGDNPRRIHWRRSARTGQLMIREMTKLRDERLWCILDTRIERDNPRQADLLEKAISAAATLICDGLEKSTKVGLICNGDPLVVLPPGGGRAYRPRLLRELAIRTVNHSDTLRTHLQRLAWPGRWRGPCVILTTRNSSDVRDAYALLNQRSGPTTILIAGTPTFDSYFNSPDDPPSKEYRSRHHSGHRTSFTGGEVSA